MQSLYSYATATADTVLLGKFPSCLCFLALRIKQKVTEGNTVVLVSMTSKVAALLPKWSHSTHAFNFYCVQVQDHVLLSSLLTLQAYSPLILILWIFPLITYFRVSLASQPTLGAGSWKWAGSQDYFRVACDGIWHCDTDTICSEGNKLFYCHVPEPFTRFLCGTGSDHTKG